MSQGSKSQAPASRSRPAGGRGSQEPASAAEALGVRRSARNSSNAAPSTPRPAKASKSTKTPGKLDTSGKLGTKEKLDTAGKLSAQGGEADLSEEGWGMLRTRESISSYASRALGHLAEYEEASKTVRRLREELRCAHARASSAPKRKKEQTLAEISRLQTNIQALEERKAYLLERSGPFKEKILNDERFREMEEEKQRRLMGLQPESQTEEESPVPYSGPPAGQAALSTGCGSAGPGEDSDSHQGGALMEEIRRLESPVHLLDFTFGDDLPEDAPGGSKPRKKKTKSVEVAILILFATFECPPSMFLT
ncbi:uncharacterized protein [Engystomops pustulosus]|uniref:uncharacterized protein n=1 Tax=Engystomops pustulosus TaxID=76066 RepID=UPI003AFB4A03